MKRHFCFILLAVLLCFVGMSAASAKGFEVQLMEEGKEYTQFTGGWPWDIQPFTLPYQRADDRVICGAWVPKATPISQDCVLAAVERGDTTGIQDFLCFSERCTVLLALFEHI